METIGDRTVIWINVTNDEDVHVNDDLLEFSKDYSNLHVLDWESISNGHTEYFYADGIHLTGEGRRAYVEAIKNKIYEVKLQELREKQEQLLKEYEQRKKSKISFYGNDLLLSVFDEVNDVFSDAIFNINSKYDFSSLKSDLEKRLEDDSLTKRIVFVFDKSSYLSNEELQELVSILDEYDVYIISTIDGINIEKDNVKVINFNEDIVSNESYLSIDKVHLSSEGKLKLQEYIVNALNGEEV